MMSAVEYTEGEPIPVVVYFPPVTSTLPPLRSVLIATLDLPEVFIVRSDAVIVPPPVVNAAACVVACSRDLGIAYSD